MMSGLNLDIQNPNSESGANQNVSIKSSPGKNSPRFQQHDDQDEDQKRDGDGGGGIEDMTTQDFTNTGNTTPPNKDNNTQGGNSSAAAQNMTMNQAAQASSIGVSAQHATPPASSSNQA